MISKEKWEALHKRMERLSITSKDLTTKYILGSGPGGQKINKTASTVYIKHKPTGTEVKCGRERSRELNRYRALQSLCERLEKKLLNEKTSKEKEAAKIRQQKKRRSRRSQQKLVADKRHLSEKKSLRKIPRSNDE